MVCTMNFPVFSLHCSLLYFIIFYNAVFGLSRLRFHYFDCVSTNCGFFWYWCTTILCSFDIVLSLLDLQYFESVFVLKTMKEGKWKKKQLSKTTKNKPVGLRSIKDQGLQCPILSLVLFPTRGRSIQCMSR